MPFLELADYDKQIKDASLDQVKGSEGNRSASELAAQAEMESYLNQRFNVGNIFNKTGAARNPLIVMYMIDIALYHLHSRVTPRMIPQIRIDRYDSAIEWLKMVAKGTISPDLPKKADAEGETVIPSRFGSNDKLSHQW